MARTSLVAGNWKMNGRLDMARELVATIAHGAPAGIQIALFPPFPYLETVCREAGSLLVGGQNLAAEEDGAFTGEVSGEMLVDLGCRMVLVGHSERRALYGEDDDLVARKFARALSAGLTPVLCVGETLAQREADETMTVVRRQLDSVLDRVGVHGLGRGVVAYEPVWAIGTGRTASPEQAREVHAAIRARVAEADATLADSLQLLYGGSVKADNAASLFSRPDIDGGLVGGASLDADSFLAICKAAAS